MKKQYLCDFLIKKISGIKYNQAEERVKQNKKTQVDLTFRFS